MWNKNSLEKSIMLGMGDVTWNRGRPRARWKFDIKGIAAHSRVNTLKHSKSTTGYAFIYELGTVLLIIYPLWLSVRDILLHWHRQQIEGANGFKCLFQKTVAKNGKWNYQCLEAAPTGFKPGRFRSLVACLTLVHFVAGHIKKSIS